MTSTCGMESDQTLALTKRLLKQYRQVKHAISITEEALEDRLILTAASSEEACTGPGFNGVALSQKWPQSHHRCITCEKLILAKLDRTLESVRRYPDNGELLYLVLYQTYFSPTKLANRDQIRRQIIKQGCEMTIETYEAYLRKAIRLMDAVLWGHIVEDNEQLLQEIFGELAGAKHPAM